MKTILFVFIVFVSQVFGYFQWQFYVKDGKEAYVEAKIGYPFQSFKLDLNFNTNCFGITLHGKSVLNPDGFSMRTSTTFVLTGDYNNGTETTRALDDFLIVEDDGNGFLLERMPFNVAEVGDCSKRSTFSLSHSFDNYFNDFIEYALIEEKEKVVTLTQHKDNLSTGFLSFGSIRPDLCSTEWHTFPETLTSFDSTWRFDLDSISVGSFKSKQPGRARFNINNGYFILSPLVYNSAVKELHIIDSYGSCTNSKNITLNLNGFDLHLDSKHYMEKRRYGNKKCNFLGVRGNSKDDFELPNTLLGDYCLMLNYERNEIGIADRLYE